MDSSRQLTGCQLRAARGLLNMSVTEMAERSGLAINTIRRAESVNGAPPITQANITLLGAIFAEAGVEFIDADEKGVGVRLASPVSGPVSRRRRSSI